MQREKFYRLYCIHPDVPLEVAVLELIRLIQTCLRLTGWTSVVPDGLACDCTIGAVRSFFAQEDFDWAEVGFSSFLLSNSRRGNYQGKERDFD